MEISEDFTVDIVKSFGALSLRVSHNGSQFTSLGNLTEDELYVISQKIQEYLETNNYDPKL
jgi:hypothetical protein